MVWSFWFLVSGFWFLVSGFWFRVLSFGLCVFILAWGFRVRGLGIRV